MEAQMYTNYLFDLYGTLVDIHTDEEKTELWEKLSVFYGFYGAQYTAEELKQSYLEEVEREKIRQKQKGSKGIAKKQDDTHEAYPEIELEYVFQNLFIRKGVEADLTQSIYAGQMFRIMSTDYIKLYDGAKELLQSLKAKGKKVYLLSNAQNILPVMSLSI